MKILISDHYFESGLEEIRALSPQVEIAKLNIEKNYGILWRIARMLSRRVLPHSLYERWQHLFDNRYCRKKISIDGDSLNQAGEDVDVFLCSWTITPDILINLLPLLPNLKWIHSTVTGVDHLLSQGLINKNIILTSSNSIHSVRIAEFVLALMLNVAKRIPEHLRLQRQKRWQSIKADELRGKIVGIIGYGHIGREVAKKARAFEMKVMAIRRSPSQTVEGVTLLDSRNLRDLLKICDFLVICVPLTKETEGLIGETELAAMKKEAYVINVSRGRVINEKALIRALKENWIAGACLDVLAEMPLPSNSPFYSLPNVIITHYSSYSSPNSYSEIFNMFLSNLKRFIAGEELLCTIDKEKGY